MSSPSNSPSKKPKTVTNDEFMALLRLPNSSDSKPSGPPKFPPLTLTTPDMVAKHTPCTMHLSVLPPELACRLFYSMIEESESWQRNKWWLFDRVVESPHRTSFYIKQISEDDDGGMRGAAQYCGDRYNGRQTDLPTSFPEAMAEACEYVERIVNAEMRKRPRFPLEWGGEPAPGASPGEADDLVVWRANVAASNRYEGSQESVGFHTDQLTNIGPFATIASLSLGRASSCRPSVLRGRFECERLSLRMRRTSAVQGHIMSHLHITRQVLCIMHASCQETFKHCIPPQRVIDPFRPSHPPPGLAPEEPIPTFNTRINITFRFCRPDFHSSTTPKCKCGVPCILRPDMKNRYALPDAQDSEKPPGENHEEERINSGIVTKYWWTCYAGAQNEGKGCNFWKVMDVKAEGRGPFAEEVV
ncbi:uncharacterized protein PHACADRAFT_184269 [Phanerochaete carnosa HHB-10118-sp]|uniref:Fe2OG dioxygenase domain-containing protein n=1 Tax=Phanerochaete carnosa (strain HHB-10118-sp) TaxID=650164 RepID=K5W928_PHACS|nr:uncharacterized protein PHACADRAFT_184269 [Phanerochaete carnosa HHB-10118-sp]EKM55474.1 hypothetical protein PHACADRAFT_184269 [Phanerochaete carnosa HHB-10118-sp]